MKRVYKIKFRLYPNSKQETALIEATCSVKALQQLRNATGRELNIDKVEVL
jgi:hypothetical protein